MGLVQRFIAFWSDFRSYKVVKFWIQRSDAIPANVENISPLGFLAFFVNFMEKKPPTFFKNLWS